jgi:hypothetical protein
MALHGVFNPISEVPRSNSMTKRQVFIGKSIKFFWLSLSVILIALASVVNPREVGDSREYVLFLEALRNHWSPDFRISDMTSAIALTEKYPAMAYYRPIFQDILNGLNHGDAKVSYLLCKTTSGQYFGLHFWFYSLLNLPARVLLGWFDLNPLRAFSLTNAIILVAASYYMLVASHQRFFTRLWVFILYLLAGSIFYLNWSHPEFYSATGLAIACLTFLDGRYKSSVLLTALVSLQNPSSVFFIPIIILKAMVTSHGNIRQWSDIKALSRLFKLVLISAISIAPYAFYYHHYGVPSLIVREGYINKGLIGLERFISGMFDLNQGIIVGIPGVAAGIVSVLLLRLLGRSKPISLDWVDWLLVLPVLILLPTLGQINWNSGQEVFMRYGVWISVPFFVWLAVQLERLTSATRLVIIVAICGLQLIPVGCFLADHQPSNTSLQSYLIMKPYIGWVFKYLPGLYHPVPEVFAERVWGRELINNEDILQAKYSPFSYRKAGEILNTLVHRTALDPQTLAKICASRGTPIARPSQQAPDFSKVKFDALGWGYLTQSISCKFNWPIALDFAAADNSDPFLGQGWFPAEPWGRWTNGPLAELSLPQDITQHQDIRLTAIAMGFVAAVQHPEVNVEILVNDQVLDRWRFQFGEPLHPRQVTIPYRLIQQNPDTKVIFKIDHPMSPQALGQSVDVRMLGLGFKSLTLDLLDTRT